MKGKFYIEESLVREIEIEIPDNISVEDRLWYVREEGIKKYKAQEIVLNADDFAHAQLMAEVDPESTEWVEIKQGGKV